MRRRHVGGVKSWGVALSCVALLCGCGADEGLGDSAVQAIYDAPEKTILTPYPSNRYTVADESTRTGLRVELGENRDQLGVLPSTEAELEAMDGFSTHGGVIVGLTGAIRAESFAAVTDYDDEERQGVAELSPDYFVDLATTPVALLNVDSNSPQYGSLSGLRLRYLQQKASDWVTESEFVLLVQPAVPLLPATRYALVLSDTLLGEDELPVARSAEMDALIRGNGGSEGSYERQVQEALSVYADYGLSEERVRLVNVFTTASITQGVRAMSELVRSLPTPKLLEDWSLVQSDEKSGRSRFRAVFSAPEFRRPLPDGRWVETEEGGPVVQGEVGLEVFLTLGGGSAKDRRVPVIYGHGLGGDKGGEWGTAERLAELRPAVFSIDSPHHGSRATNPDDKLGAVFKFFGIDPSDDSFVIGRARDNFRQIASDQLQLVRLIRSLDGLDLLPAGAVDGEPDVDVSHLLYVGHSFGSVQGPLVFALAPEIRQALWNVGGAGMMTLLRDSKLFSIMVNGLKPEGTSDVAVVRFLAIAQAIVDPGDPLNFARYGTQLALPGVAEWSGRDVLIQEAYNDGIVPNSATRYLARAAGAQRCKEGVAAAGIEAASGPIHQNLASGATVGLCQFELGENGAPASHGELIFEEAARKQYLEFFRSGLQSGHATVSAN